MIKIILGLLIILISLTYCAPSQEVIIKEDEREILRKRVDQYWQYYIEVTPANVEKAYQCELPEFREKVSIFEYVQRFKLIKYYEVEILEVDVIGNEGKSTVRLTYGVLVKPLIQRGIGQLKKTEQGTWIKRNHQWYHVPQGFELAKK